MIRLRKLYSEPEVFSPIEFQSGLNIILGEKSEGSNKTNGVGKSVCIEFLNFCLLKKADESRVLRVPDSVLEPDAKVKLDLRIHNNDLTITRTKLNPQEIVIHNNGKELVFEKLDDASEYLGNLYFDAFPLDTTRLSFRVLLAPLLRDERSEFKDIIKAHDTNKQIPRDYRPHLFLLGLNVDLYVRIRQVTDELAKKTTYLSEVKKLLTKNGAIKVSDAKARLNDLESEVTKINQSIERLRSKESFDSMHNDLVELESNLKTLRIEQKAAQYEIKQITSLPIPENISESELVLLFNQFKSGLGNLVGKSLDEVREFKAKIEGFRNSLVNKRLEVLRQKLFQVNEQIEKLDSEYSRKLGLIDNGELVKDLKTAINVFREKNEELNNLRSLISRFEDADSEKKRLSVLRTNLVQEFDTLLSENAQAIKDFELTILQIHEKIFGNRNAHFEVRTHFGTSRKEFLEFDFRISDDGSYSVERLKVFIYDLALLFNDRTKKNHPGFLVHDNIFNVDDDSLEKCLNFLYSQEQNHPEEFQYILTLNRDMTEDLESRSRLDFNVDDYRRASFTKQERFLRNSSGYTEEKNR